MSICTPPSPALPVSRPLETSEFADAYQRSFPKTFKFMQSLGANSETAEELSQAAWVKGWQCRHQLLQPQFLATWVNAIARNLYRESISRSRLSHELDDYGIHSNILRVLEVDDVISHCTEPECHLLYEHYFEGYTSAEIAVRSNVNPITVRVRLMRLRNNIRVRRTKAS